MKKTLLLSCVFSLAFAASAIEVPSSQELAKMNLQIENEKQSGTFVRCNEITLEYVNGETNLIAINNFLSEGGIVRATVDWNTGDIKVFPQQCGMNEDTGDYHMLVSAAVKDKNPADISTSYIAGKTDGKSITLDAWNLMIVPLSFDSNKGTVYPTDLTTKITTTNSTMTYQQMDWDDDWENLVLSSTVTIPVYAELNGTEITVYNWGGEPAMVKLNRSTANNKVWIANEDQVVMKRKKYSFGIYPMLTTGDEAGTPAEGALKSAETTQNNKMEFGAWIIYDKAKSIDRGYNANADITFGFDFPVETGIAEQVTEKTVATVNYVSLTGMKARSPFAGINIVETTYTDGTKSIAKVMK